MERRQLPVPLRRQAGRARRPRAEVLSAARAAVEATKPDIHFLRLDADVFVKAPKISTDYAAMERTSRAGVLPVHLSWSGVGTQGAIWEASRRGGAGNALKGKVEVVGTRDSRLQSDGVLTTVAGLNGVAVVATPDTVLMKLRAGSDSVKELVAGMRRPVDVPRSTTTC